MSVGKLVQIHGPTHLIENLRVFIRAVGLLQRKFLPDLVNASPYSSGAKYDGITVLKQSANRAIILTKMLSSPPRALFPTS